MMPSWRGAKVPEAEPCASPPSMPVRVTVTLPDPSISKRNTELRAVSSSVVANDASFAHSTVAQTRRSLTGNMDECVCGPIQRSAL